MTSKDQRLFAAMRAYVDDGTTPPPDLATQVETDLDLVRRCYVIAGKYNRESLPPLDLAERVVFEVLDWYPATVRTQIAEHLATTTS